MATNTEETLLTIKEAAARLGLRARRVRSIIADGRLRVLCIGPRTRLIRESDLSAFIEASLKGGSRSPARAS